jgi:hypothetical protein
MEQSMYLPEPNDRQFELPPAGTHQAVCNKVIDLGTQSSTYMGKPKRQHKVLLAWELAEELMSDGRPFMIQQRYTWSMSDKAALRRDLESWRGQPFAEKDFQGPHRFDIKNILGKNCLLTVMHTEKDGKHYANITGVGRLMKNQKPAAPKNPVAYLWIAEERWDSAVFASLSDHLKAVISASPEYAAMVNSNSDEPPPNEADDPGADPNDTIPF